MKKAKLTALLSLSVLAIGAVAGVAAAINGNALIGNAAGAVVENGSCGLTFGKLNKPTLGTDKTGTATSKHVQLSYKNAEAANGNHVKLLTGGEIYTTGEAYDAVKGYGSVVNGFVSVNVKFVADTGATLHLFTSFDGKTFVDAGELTSGVTYTRPETQIAPRLIKVVATGGAVTINQLKINCTAEDLVELAQRRGYYPEVGKFVGTANIYDNVNLTPDWDPDIGSYDAPTLVQPKVEVIVNKDTVIVPIYNPNEPVEANRLSTKTLYRAGYGMYRTYSMDYEGELFVEDLNGLDRGLTMLGWQSKENFDLFYNSSLNFGSSLSWDMELTQAKKYSANDTLIVKSNKETITEGQVINTEKGATTKFDVTVKYGTDDKIVWSTENTDLVTIKPNSTGKAADIKFTGKSGDAVIKVTCGSMSQTFTLHVDAPVVIEFPAALKSTEWTFDGGIAGAGLVHVNFDENGNATFNAAGLNGSYVIENEVMNYDTSINTIAGVISYVNDSWADSGFTAIDFTWDGSNLVVLTLTDIDGMYTADQTTCDKVEEPVGPVPTVVGIPTALFDVTYSDADGIFTALFENTSTPFTFGEVGNGEEVFDKSSVVCTTIETEPNIVTITATETNGSLFTGTIVLKYNTVDNTLTISSITPNDIFYSDPTGLVLNAPKEETGVEALYGTYKWTDDEGVYGLTMTIEDGFITVQEEYAEDAVTDIVIKSFDGTTVVMTDSIDQDFLTATFDSNAKTLTIVEWGNVASFNGVYTGTSY